MVRITAKDPGENYLYVLLFSVPLSVMYSGIGHSIDEHPPTKRHSNTGVSSVEHSAAIHSSVEDVFLPHVANGDSTLGFIPKVQSSPALNFRAGSSSSESDDFANEEDDNRVDKVYTVGCFDLFHRGHIALLKNMRKLGKEVCLLQLSKPTLLC